MGPTNGVDTTISEEGKDGPHDDTNAGGNRRGADGGTCNGACREGASSVEAVPSHPKESRSDRGQRTGFKPITSSVSLLFVVGFGSKE